VAFKLACGRLPDTGRDLCSQPTISRWENAPTLRKIIRLTYALVDIWCRSYQKPPRSVVLDIDDTVDEPRCCAALPRRVLDRAKQKGFAGALHLAAALRIGIHAIVNN
jgi:hypothetical protein